MIMKMIFARKELILANNRMSWEEVIELKHANVIVLFERGSKDKNYM